MNLTKTRYVRRSPPAEARPKPGLEWTEEELLSFDIVFDCLPEDEFFASQTRPADTELDCIDAAFINFDATKLLLTTTRPLDLARDGGTNTLVPATESASHSQSAPINDSEFSEETFLLVQYLRFALWGNIGQEFGIVDFARELLRTLGFHSRRAVLRSNYPIPLDVRTATLSAQTDLCLVGTDSGNILLLVQTQHEEEDPEPALIAAAIAAFDFNNEGRLECGKDELQEMTIPGIVIRRTRPTFFAMPVTAALSRAVASGIDPSATTHVASWVVPGAERGMESPAGRAAILRSFIAFKTLAETLWSRFD